MAEINTPSLMRARKQDMAAVIDLLQQKNATMKANEDVKTVLLDIADKLEVNFKQTHHLLTNIHENTSVTAGVLKDTGDFFSILAEELQAALQPFFVKGGLDIFSILKTIRDNFRRAMDDDKKEAANRRSDSERSEAHDLEESRERRRGRGILGTPRKRKLKSPVPVPDDTFGFEGILHAFLGISGFSAIKGIIDKFLRLSFVSLGLGAIGVAGLGIVGGVGLVILLSSLKSIMGIIEEANAKGLAGTEWAAFVARKFAETVGESAKSVFDAIKLLIDDTFLGPWLDKALDFLSGDTTEVDAALKDMKAKADALTERVTAKTKELEGLQANIASISEAIMVAKSRNDEALVAQLENQLGVLQGQRTAILAALKPDLEARNAAAMEEYSLLEDKFLREIIGFGNMAFRDYINGITDGKGFRIREGSLADQLIKGWQDFDKSWEKLVKTVHDSFNSARDELHIIDLAMERKIKAWVKGVKDFFSQFFTFEFWKETFENIGQGIKDLVMPRKPAEVEPKVEAIPPFKLQNDTMTPIQPKHRLGAAQPILRGTTEKVLTALERVEVLREKETARRAGIVVAPSNVRGGDTVVNTSVRHHHMGYSTPRPSHSAIRDLSVGHFGS